MKIEKVIDIINKHRTINEIADIFGISRQIVSRWVSIYRVHGEKWLVPKKPWLKKWSAWNRTNPKTEEAVCILAKQFPRLWTEELSEKLIDVSWVIMNQSTIYRILRRNKVRYTRKWDWKEKNPKLYVLDKPWREVQVDACFPFWKSRPETQYDGVDDCSRFAISHLHSEHCVRSSMEFVWNLLHEAPFRIERIRTDDWREFWPWFTKFLEKLGIVHIKNPPYTPEHNWKVERYHKTLWKGLWDYSIWIDVHEYRYRLKLFVDWYNYKKPHRWLWMFGMTPAQKVGYCLTQNLLNVHRESEDSRGEKTFLNVNLILQTNIFKKVDIFILITNFIFKSTFRLFFKWNLFY